jgi:acetyl-CoA carboxylase carboxyl transferase subunit alpha
MGFYLDFEKPIEDLEIRIEELRRLSNGQDIDIDSEIKKLEDKARKLCADIFSNLSGWQKTQLARHPDRPYTQDYIDIIVGDFIELHGDRRFSDDPAVVGGLGSIGGESVLVVGHQKGRGVREKIHHNFGQPQPEGYRKALRLMKMAEKFGLPIITLIDTPGAYPGIGAEERGQAEAIATNLLEMSRLRTPIVSIVIGEGGSGGALALGVGDRIYMLEHSVYSVISPEGCASILWNKNGDMSTKDFSKAADALRLTAQDLLGFKVINGVIPEPPGGAHKDHGAVAGEIKRHILDALVELKAVSHDELVQSRYGMLRRVGEFQEKIEDTKK